MNDNKFVTVKVGKNAIVIDGVVFQPGEIAVILKEQAQAAAAFVEVLLEEKTAPVENKNQPADAPAETTQPGEAEQQLALGAPAATNEPGENDKPLDGPVPQEGMGSSEIVAPENQPADAPAETTQPGEAAAQ